MEIPIPSKRPVHRPQIDPNLPSQRPWRGLVWVVLLVVAGIYAAFSIEDFDFLVEKDGGYDLSPQRKKKLNKELTEIEEAEQYVIFAIDPGYYPCYHCSPKKVIYLKPGEIWSD
jgi:hypothetical protein